MDLEFIIPLKKEDLLQDKGRYYVQAVIPFEECVDRIKDIGKRVPNGGSEVILTEFDTLFSFLYATDDVTFFHLQEFYDRFLFLMIKEATFHAEDVIESNQPPSTQSLNIVKMTYYLYSLFVKTYGGKVTVQSQNMLKDKKGKKKKSSEAWDWHSKITKGLSEINNFLEKDINKLWSPSSVEEQFLTLISNSCYKLLEEEEVSLATAKPLRETLAKTFSILARSYNMTSSFISNVIDLMKSFDLAQVMSHIFLNMVREHGCKTLLPKVLRELGETIRDEESHDLGKTASSFVTNLAEMEPALLMPAMKTLKRYLSIDQHTVRVGIVVTFTEMILRCLSGDTLTDEQKQVREKLLLILTRHVDDVSVYVRSKCVQCWVKLTEAHAIPKDLVLIVIDSIKPHIWDKGCYVSKASIHFFKAIIENNPYAGRLDIKELQEKLLAEKRLLEELEGNRTLKKDEAWEKIKHLLILKLTNLFSEAVETVNDDTELVNGEMEKETKESDSNTNDVPLSDVIFIIYNLLKSGCFEEAYNLLKRAEEQFPEALELRCNTSRDDKVGYYTAALKKVFFMAQDGCENQRAVIESNGAVLSYEKQVDVVAFLEEAIDFASRIESGSEMIYEILMSKSNTELLEAIEFFIVAYQFGLKNSRKAVKDMLTIMKGQQLNIKEVISNSYKHLYLVSNKPDSRSRATHVVKRLIQLVKDLSTDQKGCLQEIVERWIQHKEINGEFYKVLWHNALRQSSDVSVEESVCSLILLEMIANVNFALVKCNVPHLMKNDIFNGSDLIQLTYVFKIIGLMGKEKEEDKYIRYAPNNDIFESVIAVLVKNINQTPAMGFTAMATAAVDLIFDLSITPEKVAEKLLVQLYHVALDNNDQSQEFLRIEEVILLRLLQIYGHVMLRWWQYFDREVFNNVKRCQDGVEVPGNRDDEDGMEADNFVAADDALYERICQMCDKDWFEGNTIVAKLRQWVDKICSNYLDCDVSPQVRVAAATSLCKVMLVSRTICVESMQLYCTMMERSELVPLRANLVLGFGDLACRFPNEIEPWTPYLYKRLRDHSILVKRYTVTVLTHLITREMVKVRGQIADLALCLEDQDPAVRDIVRFLMTDLANKGNTLYNVVADIISQLSNPDREPIPQEVFESTIKFILGLITKEKQVELLVEKLCARLREARNEKQQCDLAFCLSTLVYSEKSLRRLLDALPSFRDKLCLPGVNGYVYEIFQAAQKSAKTPALKEVASEGLERLDSLLSTRGENGEMSEVTLSKPTQNKKETPVRSIRTPARKTAKSTQKVPRPREKRIEEEAGSSDEEFREKKPAKRARKKIILDSDSSS